MCSGYDAEKDTLPPARVNQSLVELEYVLIAINDCAKRMKAIVARIENRLYLEERNEKSKKYECIGGSGCPLCDHIKPTIAPNIETNSNVNPTSVD